ncbi:GGDEF domain-containing protein [Candidatus Methylomicrobium oryzae]|jgi:diguanylate cyclase (GGDEF)-like protein/PAS domain S-box-containing protein|uniref:GGDEF domain-containing protein n=1 Tax=Candidatus Methylomicrobium oryzae TaxID=2802053 RepID=UPI0019247351|nr:GGDEF domain-containing protein [Methylomicrobium sp. RS1]MBL1263150.1 EAL domain-containing protein [Methylomicrobium sp. RS1]
MLFDSTLISHTADSESAKGESIELLIVDDEKLVRDSLRKIFEFEGYKVIAAQSGREAIDILGKYQVELILLDLNMPDCHGYDVLKHVDDMRLSAQVIVISGEAGFMEARRTLRYSFVHDFIKKPYEVKALKNTVAKAQKIIRLQNQNQQILNRLHHSEQMHRFFVENSPDIIFLMNEAGSFSYLNRAVETILGRPLAEMTGQHYSKFVCKEDSRKADALFKSVGLDRSPMTVQLRLLCRNESEFRHVEITAMGIDPYSIDLFRMSESHVQELPRIFGVIRNIHERKLVENDLCKLYHAMDNSPNFIFITDRNGIIEYTNRKITETTGYSASEVVGKTSKIFSSGLSADSQKALWDTVSAGQVWRGVLRNQKKSGELYWARESIAPVINSEDEITHFVAIQEDVTEALQLTEKLAHQASHDALTQLINRQEFDRRLERVMALTRKSNAEYALCYIDLDQFKIVNDTCSHAAGDELLRQISSLFSQVIRRNDTLARLGGDEFAILMENCPLESAVAVTDKIHQAVEQFQFFWQDKSFRIGVSIGLVMIDIRNGGSDIHMKQADMACFAAKEAGRNRTHIYRADDKALVQHHGEMNWAVRINNALEQDLFCLYAQDIVPLGMGEGEHCEILLRMKDRSCNLVSANAFLPAAERYQLATKIDRWVIRNVFNYFTENHKRLEYLSLCSINLSGSSLSDPHLLGFIESEFVRTAMPPAKVCFEITETAAIANLTLATDFMRRLKEYGCKFSLDDFGSGLSSFAYLKHLPVDFLKIDGFFVKDIEHDSVDLAMVKSINDIGHMLGKKTIAEFVENQVILQTLNGLQVDYAQGYFTGKPKPLYENDALCQAPPELMLSDIPAFPV